MIELKDICGDRNFLYEKEELENFATWQLVKFIKYIRYWHWNYFSEIHYDGDYEDRYKEYIGQYACVDLGWDSLKRKHVYYWVVESELRDILKTRPNIPNKIQVKNHIKKLIHKNRKNTKKHLTYKR